jgi:hypothetical protein
VSLLGGCRCWSNCYWHKSGDFRWPTRMMALSLRGVQQQYAPSAFPTRKPYAQAAARILQLDNMDSDTSPVRSMIQNKM